MIEFGAEQVQYKRVVYAASYLTAVNQILVNVQPLVFGALAARIVLSNAELGQMASVLIATSTIGAISGPLWVRRANWRLLCALALVGAALAFLFGASIATFEQALILFGLIGAFLGILAPPAYGALGDAKHSRRAFAISVVFQSGLAAVTSLLIAMLVIPNFGDRGVFVMLAVLTGVDLPFCLLLPRTSAPRRKSAAPVADGAPLLSVAAVPAYLLLLAKALFIAGVLGYWIFVERVGVSHNISGEVIGLTVGLCAVSSALSAGIVSAIAARVSPLLVIVVGTLIIVLAFVLLNISGMMNFVLSNLLFAFGWGLAQPSYWAVLHDVDATNRLFVAGPAASGVGGVFAGLIAGPIIAFGGLPAMMAASATVLLLAAAIANGQGALLARRQQAVDAGVLRINPK